MPVITIGVAFISLLVALHLWNKHRRGIKLSKFEKIVLLVSLLTDIAILLDYIIPNIPNFSAVLGAVPLEARWSVFGASSVCLILAIVFQVRKIRAMHRPPSKVLASTIDPRFAHLTVHYSNIRDTSNTENPARPRYVTDNRRKQAYWVSDLLEPYVRQHKISWYSHDGEKALTASLDHEHYGINRRGPLPEELGLSVEKDGSLKLVEVKIESDLVSKLKGSKLEDLQIAFLDRKRFLSPSATRTLLLKLSTKQAFLSPRCVLELVENGIVASESYGMYPWENCKRWCKRHGLTFVERFYPESELTKGV